MRRTRTGTEAAAGSQVYLIHLERPYKHARHYLGWTRNLTRRLAQHRAGTGARLLRAVNRCGIGWEVVRLWPGGPEIERQLKVLKNSPRLCPVCMRACFAPAPEAKNSEEAV